jgi:succinate dehydrogenase / fumarate reductase cytochrome b subunit
MSWITRYLGSSIGKKQVVALTGLALVGFLVAHLAGNLQIFNAFGGRDAFNHYAHKLGDLGPLLWIMRLGLLTMFVAHIGLAVIVQRENWAARGPEPYRVIRSRGGPSRRTFASQSMIYTGLLVLVFVILHILTFTLGPNVKQGYVVAQAAGATEPLLRDLHRLVVEVFHKPVYVAWYVVCMVVLGLHLHHAIASVFETFGLDHPRWTPLILKGSKVVAWLVAGGFLLIPALVNFNVGVQP